MTLTAEAERRDRLAEGMRRAGGGVAIVPTAPEQRRSNDTHFPFRYDSYFHYLSGFGEPESWLVVESSGRSTLFCRERDAAHEIWDGIRLGPEAAPAQLGIDAAFPLQALDDKLPELLADQAAVWAPFGVHEQLVPRIGRWFESLRARTDSTGVHSPAAMRDLCPLLDEMRLVKAASELATMRRAAQISAEAHVRAMRYAASRLRENAERGVAEYEIEAELLHEFKRQGAQAAAYESVVAAGAHACVLHHFAGSARLKLGELCLVDAGCELDGYASDVTRTWPASGRYTPAQRALYEIVVAAQRAAIAETRPGARMKDGHRAAVRVLAQGLLDCGLLTHDRHGSVDDVIDSAAYRRYYMHGTGHWLGRDVHDVGEDRALDEPAIEEADGKGGTIVRHPSRRLEPGMVLTIEPGLYVRAAPDVPERFRDIGIRIEDDAVVTETGCELISRGVPVDADEIEALMR